MGFAFPDFDPVAFSLGPVPVRWYALAYMAGFILGWRYALYLVGRGQSRAGGLVGDHIDDFLPWAIIGVIFGGRLGYVLFYQTDMYWADPLEAFKIWHGGMSFHGGTLGVVAALAAYSYFKKVSLLRLSDILCTAAPIGLFFGRVANFINGELFGRVADLPWAVRFPAGGELPRHPSQLYEAALEGLVLFVIMLALSMIPETERKHGFRAGAFLLLYGLFRSIAELFREPDAHIGYLMGALTMGQVLSLPMVIGGAALMIWSWQKNARHKTS